MPARLRPFSLSFLACFLALAPCWVPVAALAQSSVADTDATTSDTLENSMKSQGYTSLTVKTGTGPHLEIMATINGVAGQFLVDTGAQISVINHPSLSRFKLTAVKTGVPVFGALGGAGENIEAALANRLQLGPCSASPYLLGVSDLTSLNQGRRKGTESRFDGIIGADVLQNFGYVIDFAAGRLYGKAPEMGAAAQSSAPFAAKLGPFLKDRGYSEIPMQRRSISDFEIIATVNGRKALWLVDTGAAITLLDSVLSLRAGVKLNKTNLSVAGAGGGRQRIDIGIVDNLRFASLRVRSAVIAVADISANNAALQAKEKPPIDGYLGADFLRQKGAVIDCAQKKLYLKN